MDIYKNVPYLNETPYKGYLLRKDARWGPINKLPDILKSKLSAILYETFSRPIMLNCETVNICTNDCIICPYSKMKREKTVMSQPIFEKVLGDYSDIGGGYLTLTPKNGEFFLDNLLPERVEVLNNYPKITQVSITTNAVPIDRFTDNQLKNIIDHFDRIHISIYGLDRDEYQKMTRRDYYSKMVANANRIIGLRDERKTEMVLGFRFLKNHTKSDIDQWIKKNLGKEFFYAYTNTYMNWNGAIDEIDVSIYEGRWQKREEGDCLCLLPMILALVYSNGDVSYCPCNDYDICEEFRLGNVGDESLKELFNSEKNRELWRTLPSRCLTCTAYAPMIKILDKDADVFDDPLKYVGG